MIVISYILKNVKAMGMVISIMGAERESLHSKSLCAARFLLKVSGVEPGIEVSFFKHRFAQHPCVRSEIINGDKIQ